MIQSEAIYFNEIITVKKEFTKIGRKRGAPFLDVIKTKKTIGKKLGNEYWLCYNKVKNTLVVIKFDLG